MINGKIVYVDIFDQKGIYCYFIQAIAAFISDSSFIGIYLFEVIFFTVFLYYTMQLWKLIHERVSYIYLMVFAFLIVISFAFYRGGSVEEFALPLFAYALYKIISYVEGEEDKALWFKMGAVTAILFWIKFTMCIFMIGICVYILIYCMSEKKTGEVVVIAFKWLIGMIIASLPAFAYFLLTGSMDEMFKLYIYENIFTYSGSRASLIKIIIFLLTKFNYVIIFTGIVAIAKKCFPKKYGKLLLCILLAAMCYVLFLTYTAVYIVLMMVPVYSMLFLGIIGLCDSKVSKKNEKQNIFVPLGVFAVLIIGVFVCSANTKQIKKGRDDYIYYRYADIINKNKDATLLVYRYYDEGFYVATKKIPNMKYFTKYNIKLPEIDKEQKDCIDNAKVDYIITVKSKPKELEENYVCIKEDTYTNHFDKSVYYLWKKK
ncbi:hypothetical protein [Eubacterium sp.]|uniref:hypothetical protein n=1 Tax=Eubacterium sp. TaxID=142586 RepID=UPI0025D30FB8|nr:hypothetical protein [Eubacterium sp.]MCR5628058.1 hypothetical protein [Eubacterium sp.]